MTTKIQSKKSTLDIIKSSLRSNMKQYTMFIALIGIMLIFTALNDKFLTPRNLSTLFLQTAHIAILACAVVIVIVAGHIDLSIGAVVGFTGAVAAILQAKMGLPVLPTIIITLGVWALIGIWQGFSVAYKDANQEIIMHYATGGTGLATTKH